MKRFLSFLLFLILLLPAAAPAETIVTSFYPVWVFTLNLTQGLEDITVRNLAAPETGCLHDYTLQPSDMKALAQADALLIKSKAEAEANEILNKSLNGYILEYMKIEKWDGHLPQATGTQPFIMIE